MVVGREFVVPVEGKETFFVLPKEDPAQSVEALHGKWRRKT